MTKAALDDRHAVIGRHMARKAVRATAAGGLSNQRQDARLKPCSPLKGCALNAAILCPSWISSSDCLVNL
jgi:hypothetical protein